MLQVFIEIDHHIPTEDQMKRVERKIRYQIMRREDHLFIKRRIEACEMIVGGIIGGEILGSARLLIVP